jgi:uncharacterized protein YjiS (DUF1127 family)
MAHIQLHRDNVIWLGNGWERPSLVQRIWRACNIFLSSVRQRLRTAIERSQQRRELARLSDRELRDIGLTRWELGLTRHELGLTRYDAEVESREPFGR